MVAHLLYPCCILGILPGNVTVDNPAKLVSIYDMVGCEVTWEIAHDPAQLPSYT